MQKKYDILAAGLMVYDILVSPVDASVFTRDTTRINSIDYATGGDALNVAVVAAKLGMKVAMSGVVGEDMPGRTLREEAEKHGVDTSGVRVSEKSKTSVSIVMRSGGERHFAYYGEANDEFDDSYISNELLADCKLLYIGSMMALKGLEGDGLARLFERAHKLGTLTAMDSTWASDGVWMPKLEKALPHTDIFIPSSYEARELSGSDDPAVTVDFLHEKGVRIAGVKMGKEGVYVEGTSLPAFNCDNVIDTTGAGDSFMSGFVSGIVQGMSPADAALLGSAVSNVCIRHVGAATANCTMDVANATIEAHLNGTLK